MADDFTLIKHVFTNISQIRLTVPKPHQVS